MSFKDLPAGLQEITKLAGFHQTKLVGKCKSSHEFIDGLENCVRRQLSKFCDKWDIQKKEGIFGIYVDAPSEFEFMLGQKIDLETFYENCKANLLLPTKDRPLRPNKRAKIASENDYSSSSSVTGSSIASDLRETIYKYIASNTDLEPIRGNELKVIEHHSNRSGFQEASVFCFCSAKFSIKRKEGLSWKTSNLYTHLRQHVQKLSSGVGSKDINSFFKKAVSMIITHINRSTIYFLDVE